MITRRVVFALLLPHHRRGAGRHAVKRDYAGPWVRDCRPFRVQLQTAGAILV
jgi:hypothetical protein